MANKDKVADVAENAPADKVELSVADQVAAYLAEHLRDIVVQILADAPQVDFAALVKNDVAVFLAERPDVAVDELVAKYLDANLPDLVAAAIPPTPEIALDPDAVERQRIAQAEADIEAEREKSAASQAAQAEKDRKAAVKARRAEVEAAQDLFDCGKTLPAFDDLCEALSGATSVRLFITNGDSYSPDVLNRIDLANLEIVIGRGVLLKQALVLGAGVPDEFNIHGFDLFPFSADAEPTHAPLKCALVSPVTVGGGKTASFAAGSLLFRIMPSAQE